MSSTSGSKTTAVSPSNIALIKYWGARDLEQVVPENASLSMTLSTCISRCTVEHDGSSGSDQHEINWRGSAGSFEPAPPSFADRVRQHLDFLRRWSGCGGRFRVATENSFPSAAGLASSASGFSALTLATLGAIGREVSPARQSELSRLSGSGSASRSVIGGYVLWPADNPEEGVDCHAEQIAPADHWPLRNVIAVVESGAKETSSLDGHRRARTSPYFEQRLRDLPGRLDIVRRAIAERDFDTMGEVVEAEAIDLHCIAMTSSPAIFYWQPATLTVLEAVRHLRRDGIAAYSTMDAGANVHVLCQPDDEQAVVDRLESLEVVPRIIRDGVGNGPHYEQDHLL